MKAIHKPLIVKKTKVPDLIGISYTKFSTPAFQDFLKRTGFPKPIEELGFSIQDIKEWLDTVNPNKNKNQRIEPNRSWD